MVLEAIYEGHFEKCSHGFRPRRSCHTALASISEGFDGTRWFIEGDIKGFFDNIDHEVMIRILGERIKDERFLRLIRKFLKAGYLEQWQFHETYCGTPQGGPVTVTHPDIIRFFMLIPEACRLVLEAGTMGNGGEIFVFDMGKSVKIAHLAKRMIELAGLEVDKDIKIEYTGLRPGEKLYEEVLSNTENTLPTSHDRIRIAKVREYDFSDARMAATELENLSRSVNIPDMVRLMKQTVPEFISKNSEYEKFD